MINKMNFNKYQIMSSRTINKDSSNKDLILNGCMGLAGETGELIDAYKKAVFHGHDIDKDYVAKELGDIMWYIAAIATAEDIKLDEVARMNIYKLIKRYPNGFSEEDSKNRDF